MYQTAAQGQLGAENAGTSTQAENVRRRGNVTQMTVALMTGQNQALQTISSAFLSGGSGQQKRWQQMVIAAQA